jgi:hypothetical protein
MSKRKKKPISRFSDRFIRFTKDKSATMQVWHTLLDPLRGCEPKANDEVFAKMKAELLGSDDTPDPTKGE